jgi:soluble lytic murein transglycosylase-like protein
MISVNRGKYTTPLSTYADSIIYKFSDIFKIKSSLILSIIHEETRFKHNETSYTGANGLMQLEPYTFSDVSNMLRKEFPEIYYSYVAGTNSSDLQSNIVIGIYYLKYLINTYKLDISTNNYNEYILNRVLVAYNAGPGNSYQGCSSDYSRNVIKYMHEVESTKICRNND